MWWTVFRMNVDGESDRTGTNRLWFALVVTGLSIRSECLMITHAEIRVALKSQHETLPKVNATSSNAAYTISQTL